MSTRGIIAVGSSWRRWETATYNHFDSYPDGLGKKLVRMAARPGGFERIIEAVRHHPGYSSFPEGGWPANEVSRPAVDSDVGAEYVYLVNPKARTIHVTNGSLTERLYPKDSAVRLRRE